MRVFDISILGWIHSLACIAALLLGALTIVAAKGTPSHRRNGRLYVAAMVLANLLSLGIYKGDIGAHGFAPGTFGFFHWLAVAALAFVLAGFYAALRQARGLWAYLHPTSMVLSYYVLVGGLINEAFARVDALRGLATTIVHGQPRFGSFVLGMTHMAAMLATVLLIIVFGIRTWLYRRSAKRTAANRTSFAGTATASNV
ncbi:MAG: DUF2306 domain-containing protein [Rhizomicrobium sp.]|jgi:uncharacterized membrane protein